MSLGLLAPPKHHSIRGYVENLTKKDIASIEVRVRLAGDGSRALAAGTWDKDDKGKAWAERVGPFFGDTTFEQVFVVKGIGPGETRVINFKLKARKAYKDYQLTLRKLVLKGAAQRP